MIQFFPTKILSTFQGLLRTKKSLLKKTNSWELLITIKLVQKEQPELPTKIEYNMSRNIHFSRIKALTIPVNMKPTYDQTSLLKAQYHEE